MNSEIQQKIRQYLVHSFLYYRLDESLIDDQKYDYICKELKNLLDSAQEKFDVPYRVLVEKSLGAEASGFSIRKYPPEIVSTSLHLLYQQRYKDKFKFNSFLDRFGYRLT